MNNNRKKVKKNDLDQVMRDFQSVIRWSKLLSNNLMVLCQQEIPIRLKKQVHDIMEAYNGYVKAINEYQDTFNKVINSQDGVIKEEIKLPYESEAFTEAWQEWKDYLIEQHGIRISSRAQRWQLHFLKTYSNNKEEYAINLMHYCMSKLYVTFYKFTEKDILGKNKLKKIEDGEY